MLSSKLVQTYGFVQVLSTQLLRFLEDTWLQNPSLCLYISPLLHFPFTLEILTKHKFQNFKLLKYKAGRLKATASENRCSNLCSSPFKGSGSIFSKRNIMPVGIQMHTNIFPVSLISKQKAGAVAEGTTVRHFLTRCMTELHHKSMPVWRCLLGRAPLTHSSMVTGL